MDTRKLILEFIEIFMDAEKIDIDEVVNGLSAIAGSGYMDGVKTALARNIKDITVK